VGFQKLATCAEQRSYAARSYSLIKPPRNRSTLDLFVVKVGHGAGRLRWTQFAGTVRPSTVVMANVLGEHQTQVPLTEEQYAVGEFDSDVADEPLGETADVDPRNRLATAFAELALAV
jgi:hypothetical protein